MFLRRIVFVCSPFAGGGGGGEREVRGVWGDVVGGDEGFYI